MNNAFVEKYSFWECLLQKKNGKKVMPQVTIFESTSVPVISPQMAQHQSESS